MADQDLLVDRDADGCATVTLNRPPKRNAINLAMWHGLRTTFEELGRAQDVRSILLTGGGGHFSAGADLSEFATLRATIALGLAYEEAEKAALLAILKCGKPTIAQIEGYAIGGRFGGGLGFDFRIPGSGSIFFI